MLTLLCLWCEHRNPAGSHFCNACATPLYLKPCTHCDTINGRAAAHCRDCGEAFTFDFTSAVADDGDDGADAPDPTQPPNRPPLPRTAAVSRASALLVGLIAAAGLWAFYANRDPPTAVQAAAAAEPGGAGVPVVASTPAKSVAPIAEERSDAPMPAAVVPRHSANGDERVMHEVKRSRAQTTVAAMRVQARKTIARPPVRAAKGVATAAAQRSAVAKSFRTILTNGSAAKRTRAAKETGTISSLARPHRATKGPR